MEKLLAENSKLNLTAVNEMMQERVFEIQLEIFLKFKGFFLVFLYFLFLFFCFSDFFILFFLIFFYLFWLFFIFF